MCVRRGIEGGGGGGGMSYVDLKLLMSHNLKIICILCISFLCM